MAAVSQVLFCWLVGLTATASSNPSPVPCLDGWLYSSITGKCYTFITEKKTYEDAKKFCEGTPKGGYRGNTMLGRITHTDDSIDGLLKVLGSNMEPQWIDNVTDPESKKSVPAVVTIKLTLNPPAMKPQIVKRVNPEEEHGFFCEFTALTCHLDPELGENQNAELEVGNKRVDVADRFVCKPGFYDKNGAEPQKVKCHVSNSMDLTSPMLFILEWRPPTTDWIKPDCRPVKCERLECLSDERMTIIDHVTDRYFDFGFKVNVSCKRGFVSFENPKKTKSFFTCKQKSRRRKDTVWHPGTCIPCENVRCDMEEMKNLKPKHGLLKRAVNEQLKLTFSDKQLHDFNQYGNVVTIACDDGYYFKDRDPIKEVKCDLANNSLTEGQWSGYQGTILPLPEGCVEVMCRQQEVRITDEHKINSTYVYTRTPGEEPELRNTSSLEDYPYGSTLNFTCLPEFQTANEQYYQVVECGVGGRWTPQLTNCLTRLTKLNTGNGKHFVPEAKDAKHSKSVGAIAIIFALLLLGFLIILDLSTVTRDIQYLRTNLRFVRLKLRERKLIR